ncbi:MAG TPA: cupredoxin domain-containing protein [Actinomycetota bacterium]|nr:cupredoxin domain-containing protein [Actinomycetota bacterium]
MNKRIASALMLIPLLVAGGCASQRSFATEVSHVTVDGAPGFSPQAKSVVGRTGSLKVTNTLDKEHGFSISELKIAKLVPPGGSIVVELKELKPVDYQFFCQLHDADTKKGKHQRGVLRVAP